MATFTIVLAVLFIMQISITVLLPLQHKTPPKFVNIWRLRHSSYNNILMAYLGTVTFIYKIRKKEVRKTFINRKKEIKIPTKETLDNT